MPGIVRTGSWMVLNSRVPTVVLGSNGVNKKWFRLLISVTSYFVLSRSLANRNPAQPLPKITTGGRASRLMAAVYAFFFLTKASKTPAVAVVASEAAAVALEEVEDEEKEAAEAAEARRRRLLLLLLLLLLAPPKAGRSRTRTAAMLLSLSPFLCGRGTCVSVGLLCGMRRVVK
jgi:hypothetical protein